MSRQLPLSVVVIALNEERRIGDCLASVRLLTDDLIVVDAYSRDRTTDVAASHGARVFTHRWSGYSEQKNFGNAQARYDWILSLDADERATPALAASIQEAFASNQTNDAYRLQFENFFCAKPIRFGAWNPEWHVRLFDRRKFRWNCDEVHEGLKGAPGARVGRLRGTIRHYTVDSAEQLGAKTERYSALFADKLRRQHRRPGWAKVWLNPAYRFVRDYIARGGMFDGHAGWIIAWEAARYTHLKYRLALPKVPWRVPRRITVGCSLAIVLFCFGGWSGWIEPLPPVRPIAFVEASDGFDNNPAAPTRVVVDDDVLL